MRKFVHSSLLLGVPFLFGSVSDGQISVGETLGTAQRNDEAEQSRDAQLTRSSDLQKAELARLEEISRTAKPRNWKSGPETLVAKFLEIDGQSAHLEVREKDVDLKRLRAWKRVKVPLANLSKKDQDWIRLELKRRDAATAAVAKKPKAKQK